MLTRPLGRTGIEVPLLGLGTVKFGRRHGLKYRRPFELPTDAQIADLLARAQSLGVNLLDTAPAYGSSEERLGEAIAGKRSDWLLCTKAGESFDGSVSRYDFRETTVMSSVERSLRRLRTDRLDIALLHSDGRDVPQIEAAGAFRALRRLQREGVVGAVGFSGKGAGDSAAALPISDALMCSVNARCREAVPVVAEAQERGVGVLVKKPLASGFEPVSTLAATARLAGVSSVILGTLNADHLAAAAAAVGCSRARHALPDDRGNRDA